MEFNCICFKKKTEKEKGEKTKKIRKRVEGTDSARARKRPKAQYHPSPNRYPPSLFSLWCVGPTCQCNPFFLLRTGNLPSA
jgi:hypothetical protein